MKNTQKKKITRNYHLLTKVESGKCRRVTAAIDVICTNSGGIQTNAQIGKQFFPARKRLVVIVMLFVTNDGHSKRKTSPSATPFWPQRDQSYGVTTGTLAADRPKDIADSFPTLLRLGVTNDVNGRCHTTTFSRFNFR